MPIVTINFEDPIQQKKHDDIAKLQKSMNDTYEKIDINSSNERISTPLKRKFESLTKAIEVELKGLFDLAEFDKLIPSISEIYNKEDQD